MTLLYAVRVARPEWLKAINFLAKRINADRWTERCDERLHRLICNVWESLDDKLVGWIGDYPDSLSVHLFVDADFAGCPFTLRSTSGLHLDVQGPNSRFPLSSGSNQQTALAQSTPEAEIASADFAMKCKGEATVSILQKLLERYHRSEVHGEKSLRRPHDQPGDVWRLRIDVHEDNTSALTVAATG